VTGTCHIAVAMKPIQGKYPQNALEYGVGGLNIDGCRIGADGGGTHCDNRDEFGRCRGHHNGKRSTYGETLHGPDETKGRWPANIFLDSAVAVALDEQSEVAIETGTCDASHFFHQVKEFEA
jgi:site-specific DNA-methyltransferase (adenine-specific)